MTGSYYEDAATQVFVGAARDVLAGLPAASVECVVTSPPYWGLRDYGHTDQLGTEPTPAAYIEALCGVFAEIHRVLADGGTLWVNIGDRYAANSDGWQRGEGFHTRQPAARPASDRAPKNLLGLPWRLAFALQDQGWVLRNAVVWHKPNAMPESTADRLSCRYEHVFLLVKQRRYHFDLDAVRQPYEGERPLERRARRRGSRPNAITTAWPPLGDTEQEEEGSDSSAGRRSAGAGKYTEAAAAMNGNAPGAQMRPTGQRHAAAHPQGRNPGDVWSISTRPFRRAHFAVFPIDLPLRAIAAGCPTGGTVLDPFAGAGTSLVAARRLGRRGVGIELNADYADLAIARLHEEVGAQGGPG